MHRLFRPTCIALLAAAPASAVAQDEAFFFLVTSAQLACLQQNAEAYAPAEGQTAFVTLADCGEAPPAAPADTAQFTTPDISLFDAAEAPDAVVALSAQDFTCLAGLEIPQSAGLLAFYPERCDVQPR
ncbi:hypothetical protein FHY55_17015 [Oceanicola sp. D3]|uniref:hypothetical protein n=1 Tax=Oceanicola sp. D3 TaxID=2587163 RepID=UPI0011244420|nr:hypothetical protein [Oceanicola sp. D3]QDC10830.1 hypothetical protein FHY55_17015 [Oceanicola sp. D3]